MLTLSSLEPFALSNMLIATVLGKLGKLGVKTSLAGWRFSLASPKVCICFYCAQGRTQDFWLEGAKFGWSLSQVFRSEKKSACSRLIQQSTGKKYIFLDKSSKKHKPKTKRAKGLYFVSGAISSPCLATSLPRHSWEKISTNL